MNNSLPRQDNRRGISAVPIFVHGHSQNTGKVDAAFTTEEEEMFGIGLPEMILIMALALIVVGPDKLPDLARSLAKGLMELKKTAEGLKDSLTEEGNPLDEIKPDLEEAAKSLKNNLLETPPYERDETVEATGVYPPEENAAMAYRELMKQTGQESETDDKSIRDLTNPQGQQQEADASETGPAPPVPKDEERDAEDQKQQSDEDK